MRKTKIVCTIGPACSDEETLTAMCLAGMNVARINFSHGSHEEHENQMNLLKRVRTKLNLPIAIMLDTKGPEYRIKTFRDGLVHLKKGDKFTFTIDEVEGDKDRVSVTYKDLPKDLSIGDKILLNDGLLEFEVIDKTDSEAICLVLVGGDLTDRKSMSFPNKTLNQVYLGEQDKADLLLGIKKDIDYIAASFVSRKQDLVDLKEFLAANGGDDIDIVAKIENRSGVTNIEEICEECDGIMVARGDLGVEIPYEELPAIQKLLITKGRLLGKRVITATEMLESMIYNSRPTRAEISDVANAVYDGTSAIMLSGETAIGISPANAVNVMARIAQETERCIHYTKRFLKAEFTISDTVDAISHGTCGMAIDINAKAIAACSVSGRTVRMISRFRPPMAFLGITTSEKTWRKLAMTWGAIPVMGSEFDNADDLFRNAKQLATQVLSLKEKDNIIVTGGVTMGEVGGTNLIKIETV
ncbi:MAG TPA: pyruvate kinase [Bacillota bacterium]|nr:pyruvate kinase [Bacillota bacterium]